MDANIDTMPDEPDTYWPAEEARRLAVSYALRWAEIRGGNVAPSEIINAAESFELYLKGFVTRPAGG